MHRNAVRRALACTALLSAFAAFSPANAGSITLSDSNCDSFALGGTPPNQTLTCVVSNQPTCTISGPNVGQTGTNLTLTAQCSGSPTGWSWTGGMCAGKTTQSCTGNESSPGGVIYGVSATNNIGTGPAAGLFVTWGNTPPVVNAPTGCTLVADKPSLPIGGGLVNLTASCTGGGAPTTFAWTGGTIPASGSSPTVATSVTTNTTFTVRPGNSGGNSPLPAASAAITVAGSGGGGGGGGGAISCPGYSSVIVLNLNYAPGVQSRIGTNSPFGNNDIVVAKFHTGTLLNYGKGGFINVAENIDGPNVRTVALSTDPCDFVQGVNNYATNVSWPQINFSAPNSYGLPLQSNTDYYLKIVNKTSTGAATCGSGNCGVVVTLQAR